MNTIALHPSIANKIYHTVKGQWDLQPVTFNDTTGQFFLGKIPTMMLLQRTGKDQYTLVDLLTGEFHNHHTKGDIQKVVKEGIAKITTLAKEHRLNAIWKPYIEYPEFKLIDKDTPKGISCIITDSKGDGLCIVACTEKTETSLFITMRRLVKYHGGSEFMQVGKTKKLSADSHSSEIKTYIRTQADLIWNYNKPVNTRFK